MGTKGKTSTDHDEIQRWTEVRGGRPVLARDAAAGRAPEIRLAFPGAPRDDAADLEAVSWDEWFRRFEEQDLALLMEETTSDGQRSTFNKFVRR